MADALFIVLRKVALSLGEEALEKIGSEVSQAAPIMTDFEHSMKQIEGEFSILQAFIGQVSAQRAGDKAFDAWLDQVRDVAHEVEDIIDEYAYLTAQAVDTSSFFKRKFHQIKNFVAWQRLPGMISQVEARIQRLAEMRNRYGLSVGKQDRSNDLQLTNQFYHSDSAYLTDSSEIVGHADEIGRLKEWLFEEGQDRTLISIFGMGGLGKTTIASSVYKNEKIIASFDCHAWVIVSQTYQVEELLREVANQLIDTRASMASGFMTMSRMRLVEVLQSLYPEDYKLKRKLISKLWIAEGLVEERGDGTTMEDVSECYLTELTQRSLLQVTERNAFGRARTFVMHDLVREVTSIIAKNEKFGIAYGDGGISLGSYEARRLCIQRGAQASNFLASSRIRSFILFDTEVPCSWICDILSRFRLLRVLCLRFVNIEQVPGVVTELYNLCYIDLSYTKVKMIPASFRKLVNLQVLDLRFTFVEELPLEITMLTNLRHLHVFVVHDLQQRSLNWLSATKIPGNISHLKNLQALQIVSATKDLVSQLGNLKLMRSLAILEVRQSYIAELWNSLTKMPNLSRLVISACDMDEILDLKMLKPLPNLKFFNLAGKLEAGVLPSIFYNFEKLTSLKIDWSDLKKDPISSLSHMLNLVDLQLYGSYGGEQLIFCTGWFPKLNYLQLANMRNLNWIEIEDGTMMCLNRLDLHGLGNLKVVPDGIKYIRTLHKMYLTDMSKEFLGSLQGSEGPIVQHIHNIHIFESSNSQAVNNFYSVPYLATKFGPGATKYAPTYCGSFGT